jgi:hypothetical protein
MSNNLNGWGLTARLITKHFGALGDRVSEAIANFDPETATEADRDRLVDTLRDTAQKLATARAPSTRKHKDVVNLQTLIATDERAAENPGRPPGRRHHLGSHGDPVLRRAGSEQGAPAAGTPGRSRRQAYMDELQKIVDALSKQLAEFDAQAKKAIQRWPPPRPRRICRNCAWSARASWPA